MNILNFRSAAVVLSLASGALTMGCSAAPDAAPNGVEAESEAVVGSVCGTRGAARCAASQYCELTPQSQCGANDGGGHCKTKPQMCTDIYKPVCGCDGKNYPNACNASAAGVTVASTGACKKVCGPNDWQTIIDPTLSQVEGVWSRHDQVGIVITDETLRLHASYNYELAKTTSPGCDAQGHCAAFATRTEQTSGTFVLNPGQGVQLVPSAPAPADVALSWILELPCGKTSGYRLTSTENNVDVNLTSAGQCSADSDCEPGDTGPNTLFCMVGYQHALTCNTATHKCQNTCKATVPTCGANEKLCAQCGAVPPSGVCTSFGCYPASQACPLFP